MVFFGAAHGILAVKAQEIFDLRASGSGFFKHAQTVQDHQARSSGLEFR